MHLMKPNELSQHIPYASDFTLKTHAVLHNNKLFYTQILQKEQFYTHKTPKQTPLTNSQERTLHAAVFTLTNSVNTHLFLL